MKHPALTRVFAIVLAVLCLVMLLAGLGNAAGALRERGKDRAECDRLQDRIDSYRTLLQERKGSGNSEEAELLLRQEWEEHDGKASKHRADLAIYTATRSGLRTGAAALDQADAAFYQGKAQYEAGLALFQEQEAAFWEGYRQFQEGKQQLEEGQAMLAMAESILAGLRAQLEQGKTLAAILESDDEDARRDLSVAAYDAMLENLDRAVALYDSLKEQGGISPEQLELLMAMLAEQSEQELPELPEDFSFQGVSAEQLQELEDRVTELTGMSVEEIRGKIQEQRDAAAALDADAPLSEEEFAALQLAYAQSRMWITEITAAMEEKLDGYEAQLAEVRAQMDAAQAQLDEVEPMMEEGKSAMEQAKEALAQAGSQIQMGEQGLADGRRQLNEQESKLDEQAEQLRKEKTELDEQTEALTEKDAETEAQKLWEQQERSLRLMLLSKEEIQERVDGGMELLPAAESWAERLSEQTEAAARGRLEVSLLMLLGAVGGFLGIPAAFEKTKSRFWLIAPVLLCLGCAAGAEALCRFLGRGDSYSALGVGIFALIQLLLVLPKKKTVKNP